MGAHCHKWMCSDMTLGVVQMKSPNKQRKHMFYITTHCNAQRLAQSDKTDINHFEWGWTNSC